MHCAAYELQVVLEGCLSFNCHGRPSVMHCAAYALQVLLEGCL